MRTRSLDPLSGLFVMLLLTSSPSSVARRYGLARVWVSMLPSIVAFIVSQTPAFGGDDVDETLWQQAREVLMQRCVDCHGPDTQESQLRLDSRQGITKGGDFGSILKEGNEESELLKRLKSRHPELQMPPDEPLADAEIQAIEAWVEAGYPWEREVPEDGGDLSVTDSHWAWQSLKSPELPSIDLANGTGVALSKGIEAARNPIDVFIRAKLLEKGLVPSPAADRRTIIRRLSYDLLGLPPSYQEIESFVNNESPTAYEELVDSYLNSPRYGERWARHWLDVVHYGDTHGYDKDQPRNNAWPYRDYVVRSLNQDKAYSEFIQEQIAGDVLRADNGEGVVATGFLSAGPWDLIGHLEVPETKTDGKIARHLDRDDMVANTIGSFCSITIHCAQCHNHKFDPIPQSEYYSLQSVFAAIDRGDRPYSDDPKIMESYSKAEAGLYKSQRELEAAKLLVVQKAGGLYEAWESIKHSKNDGDKTHGGFHSEIAMANDVQKWVQIDLEESRSLSQVVLHPCYDDFASIGAGFGFPLNYRVDVSNDPNFTEGVVCIREASATPILNKSIEPIVIPVERGVAEGEGKTFSWRFVRVTAIELAERENDYIFALAECEVLDEAGRNVAAGKVVTSLDSIEAPDRWRRSNLVDGVSSAIARSGNVDAERQSLEKLIAEVGTRDWESLQNAEKDVSEFTAQLNSFAGLNKVYAASTKVRRGSPRPIFVLARGNVNTPREESTPGALSLVSSLDHSFGMSGQSEEGERRIALANWIASPNNPLTWRSIVNRIWQYHFGNGIVATSSDFGRMGAVPTHPELLDWLALQMLESGGSVKSIHRLIVTSATYRQSSEIDSTHQALDSNNQYLARFTRQRLDAESIRDTVLMTAGNMDLSMGGPGWKDFQIVRPEHSPHYRYDLADPNDKSTWRRAVYRFIARSQTQPFLTSLDCADPSMRVEKRNSSITALQSLSMLNNSLVLVQSRELATRLEKEAGADDSKKIKLAFRYVLGREPSESEITLLLDVSAEAGLENVCRILFNLNELVFVD